MVVEITGYVASALVLATFWMRTMIPLRIVALGSNIAFIIYGIVGGLVPIMVLHLTLLPLISTGRLKWCACCNGFAAPRAAISRSPG